MRFDCIERPIRKAFSWYGRRVARLPWVFVIVPVIIAGVLGAGFAFMKTETDVEYLFTPQNSQARKDQSRLHEDFADLKGYSPSRSLDLDLLIRVIVSHQTSDSVWNQESLDEIFKLDDDIKAMKTDDTHFEAVCQKDSSDACVGNGLDLVKTTRDLKFPVHEVSAGPGLEPIPVFLGYLLGGVTTDGDDIKDVQAIQLVYYLNDTDAGRDWADQVIKELEDLKFTHIKTEKWQYYSIEQELAANTKRIIPYFSITFTVLITFSICATFVLDQVRSKPWLGFCGVISAGLSTLSALGLLMYCGLPFVDLVAAAPFLALGIGVDDMFVMLAAWRKTDHYMNTEDRMAEAFSEAAMSITITSVTDVLAVGIGAISPFPSVQIFCAYTALMLFMDYFFQITFFAGCMALTGKREEANRHVWTCRKVHPKSEAQGRGKCYLACCAGGVSRTNPNKEIDDTEVFMMKFFRDHFSRLINHAAGKAAILTLTLAYLGVAIWGCTTIEQGLELKNLAPDDSYVADFYHAEDQFFSEFGFQVQVVIHSPINSNEKANKVNKLIAELEETEYFRSAELTKSWLRDYQDYADKTGHDIDYSNMFGSHFVAFLQQPAYAEYADDVLHDDDVFRFILMSEFGEGTESEMNMMAKSREIAAKYEDLDTMVYSPRFIFTEQYVQVLPNTLQNLGIAVGSVLLVALLLIPHPVVCIWVALSIVSICTGVVGFMALWDVGLDTVSMINLIMCIGFCVDFSAHITYAFVTSESVSRRDRVSDALYTLGVPILQGSVSTILGVVPLAFSFSYIFRTFFKVMFLVILFGTLHGLFILPVLLSLLGPKGSEGDSRAHSRAKIDTDTNGKGCDNQEINDTEMNDVATASSHGGSQARNANNNSNRDFYWVEAKPRRR